MQNSAALYPLWATVPDITLEIGVYVSHIDPVDEESAFIM